MSPIKNTLVSNTDTKVTFFQKVVTFTLLLYPIFQTYGMFGLNSSIAYIFTTLLGALYFAQILSNNSFNLKDSGVPKYLTVYLVYAIFTWILTAGENIIPLDLIIITLFVFLYFDNIKFSYFFKKYRQIGLICIVFFWIQEFSFNATGVRPSGIIPGLTVVVAEGSTANYVESLSKFAERSSSFFSEPAHFAQFLLPLLCLELFGPKKSLLRAVCIVVTTVYLRSGNAMLGLAVIAVVYILQLFKGGLKLRQKIFVIVIIAAAGYGGLRFIETEDGEKLLKRENEVSDSELVGSGFVRIYRGYWLYGDFNIIEKMIGVNSKQSLEQHIKNLPPWVFAYGQTDYFNGVQYLLVHTGLIGTFIFMLLYLSLWKNNDLCGRSSLLCCIALSFVAAIHFSPYMFTCLLVAKHRQQEQLKARRFENTTLCLPKL